MFDPRFFKPSRYVRLLSSSCASSLLLLVLAVSVSTARPQQATPAATTRDAASVEREEGIRLFRNGDIKGAIKALRAAVRKDKQDSEAWYYLGVSLNRTGEVKEARKVFEQAVRIRPDYAPARGGYAYTLLMTNKLNDAGREATRTLELDARRPEAHYIIGVLRLQEGAYTKAVESANEALKVQQNFSQALILKSQALIGMSFRRSDIIRTGRMSDKAGPRPVPPPPTPNRATGSGPDPLTNRAQHLKEAADALEKFLELNPKLKAEEFWQMQLESLRAHAQPAIIDGERAIPPPTELTTRVRMLKNPEPTYPPTMRQRGIEGTVRLRALFDADGKVKHVLILSSPDYELSESAVRAARSIRFEPATKDGHAVAQYVTIEYAFNIY